MKLRLLQNGNPLLLDFGLGENPQYQVYAGLSRLILDFDQGLFKINFRIGTYDNNDRFRPHPEYNHGYLMVSRIRDAAFWNANLAGRTTWNQDWIMQAIVQTNAIGRVAERIWGMTGITAEIVS